MFIGREEELKTLKDQLKSRSARFIAIKGRRRIGKSRLIEEFSKEFKNKFLFTGIPPIRGVTKQSQKEEFILQMSSQGMPRLKADDWSELFWALGRETTEGPALIVLDEIAWIGSKDPAFLGKLKVAWDRFFEKNPQLILIVASSISSWIDKNILNNTGFLGRVDSILTLRELPIQECCKFFGTRAKSTSNYDKLKLLSITGGVPKYLDAIDTKLSVEENIQKLCFSKEGLLFNEFDRIFHDLFSRRSNTYKDIVETLTNRLSLEQSEICSLLQRTKNGVLSEYLNDLCEAGFLSADFTWDLKTTKINKKRKYRLSDNYLRFYLKYIAPNKQKILKNTYKEASLYQTLKWESIMGFQFENLVIHNRDLLLRHLKIKPGDYSFDGPFFQTKTRLRKGCQIDYLIQTKNILYIFEIKFSKNPVGMKVIEDIEKKIKALSFPRHVSYKPILIHVGGVSDEVLMSDFFDECIDWTKFLTI